MYTDASACQGLDTFKEEETSVSYNFIYIVNCLKEGCLF